MVLKATVKSMLVEEINKAICDGYSIFITGMAAGVDTWAAEEIIRIKEQNSEVKLVCAVPFKGAEKRGNSDQQNQINLILRSADEVNYICPKYTRWCFFTRNEWMVDHSARVIAVFNGAHGGTEQTIKYAHKKHREVIIIKDAEVTMVKDNEK